MDQQTQPQPIQSSQTQLQQPGFFHRHQRSIWLSLGSIALAVATLLLYILFFRKPVPPPEYTGDVRVNIAAPKESVSGSEISFALTVENLSTAKLTRNDLEMFYPQGFTFERSPSAPLGADGRNFSLPDLPRGEKQTLVIVGRLEGNVQEIKSITAKLHYVPENFNSFFLASAIESVVILPPDITISVLGPASIISGQVIEYDVEISNVSGEEFRNLSLELSYPPGFSFLEATPKEGRSQSEWQIDVLPPRGSKTITIKGRMMDKPAEDVYLEAELFTTSGDKKLSAGRSYVFTRMLDSPFKLAQKLIGGAGTVFGGEMLQYEVSYENVGEIGLSNVTVTMKFETPVFELMKAESQTGQILGREMVWLPAAVPELRTVDPGQRGKFSLQIPIRAEKLLTEKNPSAQTRLRFSADELLEPIAFDPLAVKLGTNVYLEARVNLIAGPEEPEVGVLSVYLVTVIVKNSVNDLENGELTARIPGSDVRLEDSSLEPAEERINFEHVPSAGILRWRLGKIFAYSGTVHNPRTISFRMSVTPEKIDSRGPVLLEGMEIAGLDSFTGEQIFSNKIEMVKAR